MIIVAENTEKPCNIADVRASDRVICPNCLKGDDNEDEKLSWFRTPNIELLECDCGWNLLIAKDKCRVHSL